MAPASESSNKPKSSKKKKCAWLRRNCVVLLLIAATVFGYALGLLLRSQNLSEQSIHLIGFPGKLVFRAFFMIIVPLLFCSLILGVASLRKGGDVKMVVITISLFLALSTFAAIMGALAGHLVHPGQKITENKLDLQSELSGRKGVILDSMLDLLLNSIPSNIIEATFTKEYTHVEIVNKNNSDDANSTNSVVYEKTLKKKSGVNFMGLLVFSILFGCGLVGMGDKGEQLHQVIEQLNVVVMAIMKYALNLLPIGLFFWMLQEGLESTSPGLMLSYLGVFLATAFGCIAFHQFILLPGLYVLVVRKNPIPFHLNLLPAILTAFGTASSAATLPVTVKCAEDVNRINRSVTRFVLPLGMVVHMNGGTFYVPLSTIFLAQLEGITLGTAETVIVCLTCILLFISAPGTTGAGNPVYLLTALAAAGIDRPQYISLVISMEWLMERFRTVMNVVADSYVAALVEKICEDKLPTEEATIDCSVVLDGYRHATFQPGRNSGTIICRSCGSEMSLA